MEFTVYTTISAVCPPGRRPFFSVVSPGPSSANSHLLSPYYSSPVTADGQVLFLVATRVGLSVDLSCTRPSVGPSRRMVWFISGKGQNRPTQSLYRPYACWRSKDQLCKNSQIVVAVTPLHKFWFPLSTNHNIPVPRWVCSLCFTLQIFLCFVLFSHYYINPLNTYKCYLRDVLVFINSYILHRSKSVTSFPTSLIHSVSHLLALHSDWPKKWYPVKTYISESPFLCASSYC